MKVLFLQNNGIQESIGIASLAGMIKANGHEADLLLASHTPDLRAAIDAYQPTVVAFSALTGVHNAVLDLVPDGGTGDAELARWVEGQLADRKAGRERRDFADTGGDIDLVVIEAGAAAIDGRRSVGESSGSPRNSVLM